MLQNATIFSSFSVDDTAKARAFYGDVLGLDVSGITSDEPKGMMSLRLDGGHVFIYQKDDHTPASYTILNFDVDDIHAAIRELASKGVAMEMYNDVKQDAEGVSYGFGDGMGPAMAWFKDPAGNTLAIVQESSR